MSDPRRLLEQGGSELERALLASASDDRPTVGARRHAALALGLAPGSGAPAPSAASAAATTATKSAGLLKLLSLAAVGGIAVTATMHYTGRGHAPAAPPVIAATQVRPAASTPAQPLQVEASPAQPATVTSGPPREKPTPVRRSSRARVRRPRPEPVSRAATPSPATRNTPVLEATLAAEVAALDAIRAALAAGTPRAALSQVHDYRERFSRGTLRPEAAALEVEALVSAGEHRAARNAGARFVAAYPRSPLARRVRALVARR